MRAALSAFAVGLSLGGAAWVLLPTGATGPVAAAHEPELSRYTYWKDIRPLLAEHCAACHVGNSPAPVNLMRYTEVLPWANAIARQVLERRMPPWLPEDGIGDLAHARTLDERETDMLVDWAIGLAPEGPPPAETPDTPGGGADADLAASRLTLEAPVRIGEMESEASVCAPLVRGDGVGGSASGFAFLPGDGFPILRRARVLIGSACDSAAPLFTWVPGQGARRRPDGVVDELPAGADLWLELRYRKGFDTEGIAYEDDPEVVVFPPGPGAAAAVETVALEPGETRLPRAALLAVLPPDDLDGGDPDFALEAVGADGGVEPLLRITRFDQDWAEKYVFREPVRLPPGARLRVSHPGALVDVLREPVPAAAGSGR